VPSRKAAKLLGSMRNSLAGWTRQDLETVYSGYGFVVRRGKRHDIWKHPDYLYLRAAVTRSSGGIAKGYIEHAIELMDKLEGLETGVSDE